jgi:hypothetical protein
MTIEQYIEIAKYGVWPIAFVLARYAYRIEANKKNLEDLKWWIIRGAKVCQKTGDLIGMRKTSIKGRLKRIGYKWRHPDDKK